MPRYDYQFAPATPTRLKMLEILTWSAIALFIGFTIALFKVPALNHLLQTHWSLYLLALGLLYVLFMLPSRQMIRMRKYSTTWVETSRKGLTFHGRLPPPDEATEKTLAWRDISRAAVTLDVQPSIGVYVRRIELTYGKNKRIRIDNEAPRFPLKDDVGLLTELQEKAPTECTFVWYFPVCPYCRHQIKSGEACPNCTMIVRFRQKLSRPQDVWGEDTPYAILFLLFSSLGPTGPMVASVVATCLLWTVLVPLLLARPATVKTLEDRRVAA